MQIYPRIKEFLLLNRRSSSLDRFRSSDESGRSANGLSTKLIAAVVLVVALSAYLAEVYRLHLERWDDAYITFRYARHLTDGLGLVWNVGGERVEGFTSFLHVVLLSFGMKLGIDPWLWSLLLSVGCILLSLLTMLAIVSRHAGGVSIFSAIIVGLYLADPVTAIHSTSGLETQLFVCLLNIIAFLSLEFFERAGLITAILLAFAVIASCLTRPEAVLYGFGIYFALGVSALFLGRDKDDSIRSFRNLGLSGLIVILGGSLYVLWKYFYFGYLLPNPYYVKSGKFGFSGLPEVSQYLEHLARFYLPLFVLVFFALVYVWLRRDRGLFQPAENSSEPIALVGNSSSYAKALILLAPAFIALAYYTTIIHEVGGGFRFSYPTYSLLVLAAVIATSQPVHNIARERRVRLVMISFAIVWFGILLASARTWNITPLPVSAFGSFHARVADALRGTGLDSRGTVICDAAGVIPYVSGFNQIDRVGLTDNFMSGRYGPTAAEREAYLWSRPSDIYIGSEPPATDGASGPASDPKMHSRYVSDVLIKRPLTLVESRIFVQDPDLLHERMRRLRDDWELIGELDWPGWKAWNLKSFVYVRRNSPYEGLIISRIKPLVRFAPEQVDLDDLYQK